jgi:hypothetical protein
MTSHDKRTITSRIYLSYAKPRLKPAMINLEARSMMPEAATGLEE